MAATISFMKDDMLLGDVKHNRPLYFTGYIGEVELPRMQMYPGSTINLVPLRALKYLGIPTRKLIYTKLSISAYNGKTQKVIGRIVNPCQIGDLKSQVVVYAIDAETSYNLLLGRPWIHENY